MLKFRFDIKFLVLSTTLLLSTMGHGDGCCSGEADPEVLGPLTGTTCPSSSPLTYANFGEGFMVNYCTRCHSSTLTGAARMGAPAFHDFDTKLGVQQVGDHVDQVAGAGPQATNESMPPNGAQPTRAEREQLAEWVACGAP